MEVLRRQVLRLERGSQMARWLRSADVRPVAFRNVRWFCVVGCGLVPTKGYGVYAQALANIYARCVVIIHGHWLALMQYA